MKRRMFISGLIILSLIGFPKVSVPQSQQSGSLIVKGHPGQTLIVQMNGRSYVDVEELARLANGSLSFEGNQTVLSLPTGPAAAASSSQPPRSTFSEDFLKAGIEEMSTIREWRSAVVGSAQSDYPVTDSFFNRYRNQASTNLQMARVAASTDADHSAFQLLSNEFDKMQKLSGKIQAARKNMTNIDPDDLQNDPLNQQILSCARSLAAMAAAGQFRDDGSCD